VNFKEEYFYLTAAYRVTIYLLFQVVSHIADKKYFSRLEKELAKIKIKYLTNYNPIFISIACLLET